MKGIKNTPASSRTNKHEAPICENLSFAAKEAFKRLRTNLIMSFPRDDTSCQLIGVTSAQPSDGKSTVSLNLAYSLAELDKKILLIDADMRRSSIHEKTGVEKTPGLSNLLTEGGSISVAIRQYHGTGEDAASFDIIPGGDLPGNPSELLNSQRMASLLQALSQVYNYVIVDLPPVGAVVDAVSVSQNMDGMIVVVRENNCPRGLLADCMQQLEYAGVRILGFVMNGAMEGSGKKYQYNNYGYGSGYEYYNSYYK